MAQDLCNEFFITKFFVTKFFITIFFITKTLIMKANIQKDHYIEKQDTGKNVYRKFTKFMKTNIAKTGVSSTFHFTKIRIKLP